MLLSSGSTQYDASEFANLHPGGREILEQYAGEDVVEVMRSGPHEHSAHAYAMLEELRVEDTDLTRFREEVPTFKTMTTPTDAAADFARHHFLNLEEPLVPQILKAHWTREFYLDQVHRPRHSAKPVRLYDSWWMEFLTLSPWYVQMTYSVGVWAIARRALAHMTLAQYLQIAVPALFVWTLFEYVMHRYALHVDNALPDYGQRWFAWHFTNHGVHHYLPMDVKRTGAPPITVMTQTPVLWFLFSLGGPVGEAIFSGTFAGFMFYEQFHMLLHMMPNLWQPWRVLDHYGIMKQYHLKHHYKNYEMGYGVTTKIWDKVWGTEMNEGATIKK